MATSLKAAEELGQAPPYQPLGPLTLRIGETPKQVLLQTDELQHNAAFHLGLTVCKGKKDKRIQYFLKIIT